MLCALVECSTRFTMLLYLPNGHVVVEVDDVLSISVQAYLTPCVCCRWDWGSDLAWRGEIASECGA